MMPKISRADAPPRAGDTTVFSVVVVVVVVVVVGRDKDWSPV